MLHADSARNRLVGIGLASLTYLMFSLLDGSAKWLVTGLPVVMVVWLRFFIHALIGGAILFPVRGLALVRTRYWRWHLLRGVMFMAMTGMNFWALQYLQLTITGSIFFSVPLIIAMLAAPILGEKLDTGRWIAIVAGFLGVLVIVRPGSAGFHPAMLVAIGNAVLYSFFMLMTRRLATYDSAETIQYLPAVVAAVGLLPFAIASWQTPATSLQWAIVGLTGLLGGVGHHLLALAHRYAPATVIAPFLYQQVFYMALIGYLVFGDVPDASVWIGAAIVIGSGLYLFYRERTR